MTITHVLRCECGKVKGEVRNPRNANRGICYCRDCQAFAQFLNKSADVLDAQGGTEVIQTIQANVAFQLGVEHIACMRLTRDGLLRWYSRCCRTPIGNTPANHRTSFIGLIHACLHDPARSLEESFGPIRMAVNTSGATGPTPVASRGMLAGVWRFICMVALARINGDYRRSPFFRAGSSLPIVEPEVFNPNDTTIG